jgi:chromosome segregation ATPase
VLDDEIPEEIKRLESQKNNVVMRYKASTRRRTTILDQLYSCASGQEEVNCAHRLLRQLDELKELTQGLDRLAEELHSVDQQLSHLESLTHIHTGSALALALRKLNSSFLKQVAENQVLKSKIQSLEAERDEAWQQAQRVADEYDQLSNNSLSSHSSSSRMSAKRKSSSRVSRAGLRTPNRSPPGIGNPIIGATRSLPPPLPKLRPRDIVTDFPVRNSVVRIPLYSGLHKYNHPYPIGFYCIPLGIVDL